MLKPPIDLTTFGTNRRISADGHSCRSDRPETLGEAAGLSLARLATLLDQLDRAGPHPA